MQQVQNGDKVRVHYHGKLRSRETLESSQRRYTLEINLGGGQIKPSLEHGVMGMQVCDKSTLEKKV